MAELPRYQQTGRVFADVPQLDFANVRESFKKSASMSAGLDRLSEYAFKEAGKQAEVKAAQFAVDNPITLDDLKKAQESGISPDELVKASGGGKIWQETLSKLQGEQLRTQLEVNGQSALANIFAQVQAGVLKDSNEIKNKLDAAVNGMSAPLNKINPESAIKFKHTMGTVASSYYKQSVDKLADDYKNEQKILAYDNINNVIKAQRSLITTTTDPVLYGEATSLNRQRIYRQALEGGSDFALEQVKEFDKVQQEIKTGFFVRKSLSPEYSMNPVTKTQDISYAMKRMRAGDFGEHSALFETLSQEDKDKVMKESYSMFTNEYESQKKQQDAIKTQKEQEYKGVLKAISKGQLTGKALTSAADELFDNDIISFKQHEELLSPKEPKVSSNQLMMEASALHEIRMGNINNVKQLQTRYPSLSTKQVVNLWDKIDDNDAITATQLHNKYSGADSDPGRTKPNTQKVWTEINVEYTKNLLEADPKTGEKVFGSKVEAMRDAITKRQGKIDFVNYGTRQKSLHKAIKDLGYNADDGVSHFERVYKFPKGLNKDTDQTYKDIKSYFEKYEDAKSYTKMKVNDLPSNLNSRGPNE
jgi:hypothetical protein